MCTVIYLQELGLLTKNRDKELPTEEEVIVEQSFKGVRAKGADYYSCALNNQGCAFVSTAVNGPAWTRAVEEGNIEAAKLLCAAERDGLEGPTRVVSEMISSAPSIDPIIARLTSEGTSWYGYNVILADRNRAVVVETQGQRTAVRPLNLRDCVTNHFHELGGHGPLVRDDYPNSFNRFDYAKDQLPGLKTRENLFEAINPTDPAQSKKIWREGAFHTVSSTTLSLTDFSLYFSSGRGAPFERY